MTTTNAHIIAVAVGAALGLFIAATGLAYMHGKRVAWKEAVIQQAKLNAMKRELASKHRRSG